MRNLLLALFPLLLAAPLAQAQRRVPLYTGTIPNATPSALRETTETGPDGNQRVRQVVQPELLVYPAPADKATGTAVIICPGGGYELLSLSKEGDAVARRFNELGITAFVLKYRLPNDDAQPDKSQAPLLDAQQAIRLVREQAARYRVRPDRIGLLGFSAGGHLAAMAGTRFERPLGSEPGATSVRPDFLVLVYPVITFADSLTHAGSRSRLLGAAPTAAQVQQFSAERQVSAQTPPTFLVHAQDDASVPVQNSLLFYQACLYHGVPTEMHLYARGGHGFGLRNPTTPDDWFERLRNWLETVTR